MFTTTVIRRRRATFSLSESLAEGGQSGDSLSVSVTALTSVSEGLTLSDTVAADSSFSESLLDALTFSDSISVNGVLLGNIVDNLSISDLIGDTGALSDTLAEGGQLSDVITTGNSFSESLAEALHGTSLISVFLQADENITEAGQLIVSKSVRADILQSVTEGLNYILDRYNVNDIVTVQEGGQLSDISGGNIFASEVLLEAGQLIASESVRADILQSVTEGLNYILDRYNVNDIVTVQEGGQLSDISGGNIFASEVLLEGGQLNVNKASSLNINISLPEFLQAGDTVIHSADLVGAISEQMAMVDVMNEAGVIITLTIRHAFLVKRDKTFII